MILDIALANDPSFRLGVHSHGSYTPIDSPPGKSVLMKSLLVGF
jgi:hypothetical protein